MQSPGFLREVIWDHDLTSVVKNSSILMYADDVKLFLSFSNPSSCSILQEDLNNFGNWCEFNLMSLNLKKCKTMSFYRGGYIQSNYQLFDVSLNVVTSIIDLGITMDPKLSFTSHINKTINKARLVLGFIKR